jgi:hypothetical protein
MAGLLLIGLIGCDKTTGASDGGVDAGLTLCKGPGCIGAQCAKDADCTEGNAGKAATCWVSTILNNPKLLTTPDGYCSRECDSDADCGTGKCYTLPNASKRYCMARCDNAATCRKPGYVCAFDGPSDAICFPSSNFNCDPTANAGYCDYGPDKYIGGCLRGAYEDLHGGVCHLQCKLGTKTCPPDTRAGLPAPAQQCIYIDAGLDGRGNITNAKDTFRGNICFRQTAAPKFPGAQCSTSGECQDGYECDLYAARAEDRICRALCVQGDGIQVDLPGLLVPMGAVPATNVCAGAGETCGDSLLAGARAGDRFRTAGLCIK